MRKILFLLIFIPFFVGCANKAKDSDSNKIPEQKTVYTQNDEVIAKLISEEYPDIVNLWTYWKKR